MMGRQTLPGQRLKLIVVAVILSGAISGCSAVDPTADLEQYVRETQERQRPHIEPLPEIKPYKTFLYGARLDEYRTPFAPSSGGGGEALPQQKPAYASGPKPDLNRRKEALEQFPLDALRMQGTVVQNGVSWGIVIAPDKSVHRVQVDNYLGRNFGRISRVTEDSIEVMELVPDGANGWQQREAALALNQ
jgi:type IV pilus assembly protein PilP